MTHPKGSLWPQFISFPWKDNLISRQSSVAFDGNAGDVTCAAFFPPNAFVVEANVEDTDKSECVFA